MRVSYMSKSGTSETQQNVWRMQNNHNEMGADRGQDTLGTLRIFLPAASTTYHCRVTVSFLALTVFMLNN